MTYLLKLLQRTKNAFFELIVPKFLTYNGFFLFFNLIPPICLKSSNDIFHDLSWYSFIWLIDFEVIPLILGHFLLAVPFEPLKVLIDLVWPPFKESESLFLIFHLSSLWVLLESCQAKVKDFWVNHFFYFLLLLLGVEKLKSYCFIILFFQIFLPPILGQNGVLGLELLYVGVFFDSTEISFEH